MFLFTVDKKIKYDRLLMLLMGMVSVVLATIVITKSTEHYIDTIQISKEGAQMIKAYDLQLEVVDLQDEHLSNAILKLDQVNESLMTDENGEIYAPGEDFGFHEILCQVQNGKAQRYGFQITYDPNLQKTCRLDEADATHFYVPYDTAKCKIQMVYGNDSLRMLPMACYTDYSANTYLPDSTVITQDLSVIFSDSSSLVEQTFQNRDGTAYPVGEDLYLNESGIVIFEDGSFVNPGRSVYVKSGHLHMICGMAYDFGNGYWIDAEGIIHFLRDGVEWLILQDGTIVLPDGTEVKEVNALKDIALLDDNTVKKNPNNNSKKPNSEKEQKKETETKEKKNPPKVEEMTGGTWQQASKLHVFSDSSELTGGAYVDKSGRLVFCPGSKGTYYFRIATNGNQKVQFSLGLYQGGNLPIPLKFKLTCADGTASQWFSMENAKSVATALTIDQNVQPSTNYTNYQLTWWWDDSAPGQDAKDTELGVKAAKEDVNYEIYALLTVTCE